MHTYVEEKRSDCEIDSEFKGIDGRNCREDPGNILVERET